VTLMNQSNHISYKNNENNVALNLKIEVKSADFYEITYTCSRRII